MSRLDGGPAAEGAGRDRRASTERREVIRARVVDQGSVRIDDLAAEFAVTVMTIHRDLNVLEEQGWLRKVRGGATVDASALIDTTVRHRLTVMVQAKREIARSALPFVDAAESIILDDSTTALELARLLPGRGSRTVITNALMAINALSGAADIDLVALGGNYRHQYEAFYGPQVHEAIAKLRADVLFMSTTAVVDGHLYNKSHETILIRQALMESAARRILLVDHAKFSRRAVHQLAALTDFDAVVVDSGIDAHELAAMRADGVNVHVADTDARSGRTGGRR